MKDIDFLIDSPGPLAIGYIELLIKSEVLTR